MSETIIVVGGGLAGAKTVEALREQGFSGRLVLICEETSLPYERPPLSKDYLAGNTTTEDFTVHTHEWYRENGIELHTGVRVSAVHNGLHEVELDDDSRLGYDKLVLATGSRPRRLPLPGADARGVHYLRRLGDSNKLRGTLDTARQLVVIGAGWIGLEVAAVARGNGVGVTVVEAAAQPLLGALGPRMGEFFADLHREHGVDLHLGAHVSEIRTDAGVTGVRMTDGTDLPADAVLIAVGARPEVTLAERAGLDVEDGVLTDASMTTSDPDILAIGDIANARHPLFAERVRVEHWANALNQPRVAAATLLGKSSAYDELPYFFTDQYDLGMEYHGYVPQDSGDRVLVRGNLATREFIAFWLDDADRVLAGMNVNVWDVGEAIKALIRAKEPISAERLTDPAVPLDDLAALRA